MSPFRPARGKPLGFLKGAARLVVFDLIDLVPPTLTMPVYHRLRSGRWPNPSGSGFSDRLYASKFMPITPEMVRLADKAAVKEIVRERLGPDWVVPTHFVGESLPPVDHRTWPLPFVIKATHGSGWNIFVREPPDWPAIERTLSSWLRRKPYRFRGEFHYRQITPRVIVEPMINGRDLPNDYKVLVIGGKARFVQVDTGREAVHHQAYYDRNWQKLPITRGHPPDPELRSAPARLPELLEAAERMAAGFDFLRVDFYEVDGQPYFGEGTFFPGAAVNRFDPLEYEQIIGDMWSSGAAATDPTD